MVAKVLLHKFIRQRKLLLFLLVSVLILFYVCMTDNMVFMKWYTTRKAELNVSSTDPSFKQSRSSEHAFTKNESKESAGKMPLLKTIKSTRKFHLNKQLNGYDNTLEKTEGHYLDDLSPGVRKPTIWILTRSDTNQAVQPLKMARGWKFWI